MTGEPQPASCPHPNMSALDECFTRLCDNIRHLALRLRWASTNPTLTSAAQAYEAYLKLRRDPPNRSGKTHEETISIFADAMRQILVDATRRKKAHKRDPEVLLKSADLPIEDALSVALAVEELSQKTPQQGRIAEARFLLGMTTLETGLALGLSQGTVEREWKEAKACLTDKLLGEKG